MIYLKNNIRFRIKILILKSASPIPFNTKRIKNKNIDNKQSRLSTHTNENHTTRPKSAKTVDLESIKNYDFSNEEKSETNNMLTSITNAYEKKSREKNKDHYREYYDQSRSFVSDRLEYDFPEETFSHNYLNQITQNKTNKFHYTVAEFNKFKNKLLFKAHQNQKLFNQTKKCRSKTSPHYSGSTISSPNYLDGGKESTVDSSKHPISSASTHLPPPPTPQQSQIRAIYETIQRSNSSNPKIFSIDLKRSNHLLNLKKTQNLLSSLSIKKIN
jgi:hypothetical protein